MRRPVPVLVRDTGLLQERLDSVCRTMGPMFAMNILGTAMMASIFWRPATAVGLGTWLVANTLILIVRAIAARAYLRRRLASLGSDGWAVALVGLTAVGGISWGLAFGWMIAAGTDNQIMLVVCISFAAVSMSMANMTYLPIFAAFQVPVTMSAAIGFLLSTRTDHYMIAVGAVAVSIATLIVGHRLAGQVLKAFRLAVSNQALVDSLADRGRELERAFAALEHVSRTDPLTGLANRRGRDERLEREWARAARMGTLLSVIAIDVDRFKSYNDTHGHDDGDRCLQAVGAMLLAATRGAVDMAARHGGEEFMLILPGLSGEVAASVAERVRVMIARCHGEWDLPAKVTVSLGVATANPASGGDLRGLTTAADAALYRAKVAGRNRYETSPALIGHTAAA